MSEKIFVVVIHDSPIHMTGAIFEVILETGLEELGLVGKRAVHYTTQEIDMAPRVREDDLIGDED